MGALEFQRRIHRLEELLREQVETQEEQLAAVFVNVSRVKDVLTEAQDHLDNLACQMAAVEDHAQETLRKITDVSSSAIPYHERHHQHITSIATVGRDEELVR